MSIKKGAGDLYVDVSVFKSNLKAVKKTCQKIDEYFEQYYSSLCKMKELGLVEGKTADALSNYISKVSAVLNKATPIGNQYADCVNSFLSDIDVADGFLYKNKGVKKLRDSDFNDAQKAVLHNDEADFVIISSLIAKIKQFVSYAQYENSMKLTDSAKKQLKNKTAQELRLIKSKVRTTDSNYSAKIKLLKDSIDCYQSLINMLFQIVNPNAENFYSEKFDKEFQGSAKKLSSNVALIKKGCFVSNSDVHKFATEHGLNYFDEIDKVLAAYYSKMNGENRITFELEEYYLIKSLLTDQLNALSKDYVTSKTNVEEYKKRFDEALNNIKKYGDEWEKHTHMSDEEKESFKTILDKMGGLQKFSSYADEAIEVYYQLFFSMAESKKALNAIKSNYKGTDSAVKAALEQLENYYNKQVLAIINETTEHIINHEISLIKKLSPSKIISKATEVFDKQQEQQGITSKRNAVELYDWVKASESAYENAVKKLKGISKDSPNYNTYVYNVRICFESSKNAKLEMLKLMIESTKDNSEKTYYQYCHDQIKQANINIFDLNIVSENEYNSFDNYNLINEASDDLYNSLN